MKQLRNEPNARKQGCRLLVGWEGKLYINDTVNMIIYYIFLLEDAKLLRILTEKD